MEGHAFEFDGIGAVYYCNVQGRGTTWGVVRCTAMIDLIFGEVRNLVQY